MTGIPDWVSESIAAEEEDRLNGVTSYPTRFGGDAPTAESAPTVALADSRVDLIELIRQGIPEPEFVPGGSPWLRKGKRYLIPAPAGTGKSLVGLIVAVNVVQHGGRVVILDVENGADEYARRLDTILTVRDEDASITRACRERLSYHSWPVLRLDWTADEWAGAIAGADLVIFDSSRLLLSSVGLGEDSNDEYSQFVTAIVLPLAKAGSATILLDNTGHGEKERARGASTKADLNEVVYMLDVAEPFEVDKPGQLRMKLTRSRFSGLPKEMRVHVGGDTYTPPVEVDVEEHIAAEFRPTINMERVSMLLERTPGLGVRDIRKALGGNGESVDLAVSYLLSERYIEVPPDHKPGTKIEHRSVRPYRRDDDPKDPDRVCVSEPCPDRVPDTVRGTVSTVSPLKGDTVTDTVHPAAESRDRV